MARVAAGGGRGGVALALIMTVVGIGVLVTLGVWQLERKTWKEGLIARMTAELSAPPQRLPAPVMWTRLNPGAAEFRRVTFPAEFDHAREALVYTASSALRRDVSGPGYWVITPAQLPGGSIVMVNRGFIPESHKDPKTRAAGNMPGMVDITGVLRWPEPRGLFTPADDPTHNIWYLRDHLAIAAAKKLGTAAPFYVDQESPEPAGGLPKPGQLQVNIPNHHLQYSLTWFSLALALACVFLIWALRRSR